MNPVKILTHDMKISRLKRNLKVREPIHYIQ